VSVSLERIGDVELAAEHHPEALAAYEESLEISRRLAANADWQWDLSVAYQRVAGIFELDGRGAEVIVSYRKSLAIAEKLTQADRANATWERGEMLFRERLALQLEGQGERDAAIEMLRELIWQPR
jgi:tetratricopeptide (TPR) repeat protein